jgi:hypothetical protein
MKQFQTDLNLDDEPERQDFLDRFCGTEENQRFGESADTVASQLGFFSGASNAAEKAAQALIDYAQGKEKACRLRIAGEIREALKEEAKLDKIYLERIQPHIDCW